MSGKFSTFVEKNSFEFTSSSTAFDSTVSSDSEIFLPEKPEIIVWGVSNEVGEIQKSIGRFSFPWKELIDHGYSPDYLRCLLSEMTPYAVAETEDSVVVVYSPAKLIGGSEIANLVDGKCLFRNNEDSDNQTIEVIDDFNSLSSSKAHSSHSSSPTSVQLSPTGIFSKIKQWFSF